MAVTKWEAIPGAIAGGTISKYRFVKMGTVAYQFVSASVAGERCAGVSYDDAPAGQSLTVAALTDGNNVVKVQVGAGGLTVGAAVTTDTAGRAVVAATGNVVLGQSLGVASNGDIAEILTTSMYTQP